MSQRDNQRRTVHLHVQVQFLLPAAAAVLLAACSSPAVSASVPAQPAAQAASQAAEPETEAGVRAAAAQFYALYAAGQWAPAWAMLTPASQAQAPEAVYIAVHQGCPSPSAGMARVIKSVVMAGSTAVVTETIAGALGSLASATDAWQYSGGRWGFEMDAATMAVYSHGSAAADLAAAKAAGDCAGYQPSFSPPPTMATLPEPTFAPPSPFPTLPAAS